MSEAPTLDDIRRAARVLEGQVQRTPSVHAARLSDLTGASVMLKLENLQVTGSFKPRGAYVKLASLDGGARARGVIAMSAGNHAQGVAYHAGRLGVPATIVMPRATPFSKVERTRAYGAEIVLEGDSLSEAASAARAIAEARGLTFIHPYDDPLIVAGQGTVALELLDAAPDLDTLIVPIGGGGLIAGIAIAAKALRPAIRVVGVQTELYPSMVRAVQGGDETPRAGTTVAEGIAVKDPGVLTRAVVARLVDELVRVDEAAIERALALLLTEEKLVAEGAGAVALAALLVMREAMAGRRIGLVISGGNIDPRIMASVLMRALARDGRMARLRLKITDAPGRLASVSGAIAAEGGNIVEVHHQRLFQDVPVTEADLDVTIETRNASHLDTIIARLEAAGFPVQRLGYSASAP